MPDCPLRRTSPRATPPLERPSCEAFVPKSESLFHRVGVTEGPISPVPPRKKWPIFSAAMFSRRASRPALRTMGAYQPPIRVLVGEVDQFVRHWISLARGTVSGAPGGYLGVTSRSGTEANINSSKQAGRRSAIDYIRPVGSPPITTTPLSSSRPFHLA